MVNPKDVHALYCGCGGAHAPDYDWAAEMNKLWASLTPPKMADHLAPSLTIPTWWPK